MVDIKTKRFQFLQTLYNESDQDELKSCNAYKIGEALGFDENTTYKIIRYFINEGLILKKPATRPNEPRGAITITHSGICHVESTLEKRSQSLREIIKEVSSRSKHSSLAIQNTAVKDKRKSEKWYQTNTFKFVIIPIAAMLFLGLPSWFFLFRENYNSSDINIPIKSEGNHDYVGKLGSSPTVSVNEPNSHGRTPLYARTKKRVYDICERIEEEKLNPWRFINIDKMRPITMHNGKVISIKGVLYEGSPRLVFWSDDFIPPFIEDAIVQVFNETIEECHKNDLEPKPYIDEANRLLLGFILHVYSRMADIDKYS
jgi:hypothetical protein